MRILAPPDPPHLSAAIHTFLVQQVPTAQTRPDGQSALVVQSASPVHGVVPSAQKPEPPAMETHKQVPPGPQGKKLLHVLPVQVVEVQAPLEQVPLSHLVPQVPQFAGSVFVSTHLPWHKVGVGSVQTGKETLVVTVVVSSGTVEVPVVIPSQEQALEYLDVPEQGEA